VFSVKKSVQLAVAAHSWLAWVYFHGPRKISAATLAESVKRRTPRSFKVTLQALESGWSRDKTRQRNGARVGLLARLPPDRYQRCSDIYRCQSAPPVIAFFDPIDKGCPVSSHLKELHVGLFQAQNRLRDFARENNQASIEFEDPGKGALTFLI